MPFTSVKQILKVIGALSIIGLLAFISIVTLVEPNQFKKRIEQEIATITHQPCTIKGALSWELTPRIALVAQNLTLPNVSAKKIAFKPRLSGLLVGKWLIDIEIEELNATLTSIRLPEYKTRFLPYTITLTKGTLLFNEMELKNVALTAQKTSLGFVGFDAPLDMSGEIVSENHPLQGQFTLSALWTFNAKDESLEVKAVSIKTTGMDLPFTELAVNLHIKNQKTTIISGDLHIPHFNAEEGLSYLSLPFYPTLSSNAALKTSFIYEAPHLTVSSFDMTFENKGRVQGSFKTDYPVQTDKKSSITGTIDAEHFHIGSLPIDHFSTTLTTHEKLVILDPIKAQFAGTRHQARLQINSEEQKPHLTLHTDMQSFEINELLARLNQKDKLYGNLNATLDLTGTGQTPADWLQSLSGKAYVHATDGRLRGIDLSPLLRHAQSTIVMLKDTLSKRSSVNVDAVLTAELGEWKLQAMNVDLLVTPFRHLETNITFNEGKAYTSDFTLTHPEYTVKGQGTLDFLAQQLEYEALALLTHPKPDTSEALSFFLKETPLAIHIKGPLNNLMIHPNLPQYANQAIHLSTKEPVKKSADQSLEKLFGFPE